MMADGEPIFAREERTDAEAETLRLQRMRGAVDALVQNRDFRTWFASVMDELCGNDFGTQPLDDFTQGKRATASFLRATLLVSPSAPKFLAELVQDDFNGRHRATRH